MEASSLVATLARPPRILVTEDDDDLRLTIRDWLNLQGYSVQVARDGLESLDLAARQPFDVVVTDLKMPRCDGLRLLKALKDLDAHVEVIFLTGQATLGDAIEALRGGRSFDFLQKPLQDLRRLHEVIQRAILHRIQTGTLRAEAPETPWPGLPAETAAAIGDEPALQQAFRFIATHYRQGIGLSEVADATGYSAAYLTSRMRRITGKTIHQWILEYKLAEACRLLTESDESAQRIAEALGYPAGSNFHRQFRKAFGVSPLAWRKARAASS